MLIGLVGKANVGKSTFFKAATLAEVEIANYPFTTLKPNSGVAYIKVECPDKEFSTKCNPKFGFCINSQRFIPVQLIDVPGLIRGAHEGRGMGNEFLNSLIPADVLIHVVDISGSTDEKGEPVPDLSHDPAFDIKFLELELDQWYFQTIKKGWEKFSKKIQQEKLDITQSILTQVSGLKVKEEHVKEFIRHLPEDPTKWTDNDLIKLASHLRKKSKPMIIAANKCDLKNIDETLGRIKEEFRQYAIIPCSAESELALREAAKKELIDYIPGESNFKIKSKITEQQEKGLKLVKEKILAKYNSTGIQQVLDETIKLLNLITVYPVENENKLTDKSHNVLPDAFLMPNGSTSLNLAFAIHTDIGKKFKGAIDAKTKKKLGKDYKLKNNDVIKILT